MLFLSYACGRPRRNRRDASDRRQPLVATLTLTGAVIVVALRNVAPDRMLRMGIAALSLGVMIRLAGIQWRLVGVMMFGTVVSGLGFGSVFSGTLGTVMRLARPDERASLLSTYFVVGYLATAAVTEARPE